MATSYSIGKHFEAFIDGLIESGVYDNNTVDQNPAMAPHVPANGLYGMLCTFRSSAFGADCDSCVHLFRLR